MNSDRRVVLAYQYSNERCYEDSNFFRWALALLRVLDKATTLVRTESVSYSGFVQHTIYEHDRNGRIITIKEARDDAEPAVTVTITYTENEVVLLSAPDWDPSLNQTKKVVLTLDGSGRTQKRIEYTYKQPKLVESSYESFVYDTLHFEYDASGFLIKTEGSRYDSTWIDATRNQVTRATSHATYTIQSGNVVAIDEFVEYPRVSREGGLTIHGGGSSEYHKIFKYTKSYPNKADFRNAAVLNEYKQYFDLPLNMNWSNMPDQVVQSTKDRHINGTVIFEIESTIEMERIYNGDGLLSAIMIPRGNVQYIETRHFYR